MAAVLNALLSGRKKAKRKAEARKQAQEIFADETGELAARAGRLETAVEKTLGTFLEPFKLSSHVDVVRCLTGSGFTSVAALRGFDAKQGETSGIRALDASKIIMAAWLDSYDLVQYGATLVEHGITSLLTLLRMSDARLRQVGILAIGHRRQLQRFLRQDEDLQELAAQERAAADAESKLFRTGDGRGSKGPRAKRYEGDPSLRTDALDEHGQLRFEPIAQGGHVVDRLPEGISSSLESDNRTVQRQDAWYQPWRTMANAALVNGAAPGMGVEAHVVAATPRDGFVLRHNDGSEMRVW